MLYRWSVLVAVVWVLVAPVAAQRQLVLPEIVAESRGETIPVRIVGPTAELQRVAEVAFHAHGRFRVEGNAARAAYTLTFGEGAVPTEMTVRIEGGGAVVVEAARGGSPRAALLRAADRAVTRITRLPGFFGGRLAFTLERGRGKEVCTADLFLGEMLQVTSDGSQALMPRWSPDGRKIVYTSYFRTGFPDLYVLDLAARRRTPFVTFKGTNTAARFSPSGREVAMSLSGSGNPEVYVAGADGRGLRRLTNNPGVDTSPAWSPDGTQVVFTSSAGGRPQLYVMSPAGGTPRRLATNISGYCAEPTWNPVKPNLIAFTAGVGSGFQVAVFDRTAGQSRILTQVAGDAVEPVWTSDGRHLVFTQRRPGTRRLMLLDTEGGKVVPLSAEGVGLVAEADFVYPDR